MIDLGQVGRHNDGGVFANSAFGNGLEQGTNFPNITASTKTHEASLPHVIVGDEAFPLRKYMLRPYPGRYFPGIPYKNG